MTGEKTRSIVHLFGWCGGSDRAFSLLNTGPNSWYAFGKRERSGCVRLDLFSSFDQYVTQAVIINENLWFISRWQFIFYLIIYGRAFSFPLYKLLPIEECKPLTD